MFKHFYRNVKNSSYVLNTHTSCCMFCTYLGSLSKITARLFPPVYIFIQVLKVVHVKSFNFENSREILSLVMAILSLGNTLNKSSFFFFGFTFSNKTKTQQNQQTSNNKTNYKHCMCKKKRCLTSL